MHNSESHKNSSDRLPKDRVLGLVLAGILVTGGLFGGSIYWGATTRVDGAVIAPGTVALKTNRQVIQHLEGGIISEILVREGETVRTGQTLVYLDTTQDKSELDAVTDQIASLTVQRARLAAELVDDDTVTVPETLLELVEGKQEIGKIIETEIQLFDARIASRKANTALLNRRKISLEAQVIGLFEQKASLKENLQLTNEELDTVADLEEKKLVSITRVLEVRRNILGLQADISGNDAESESLRAQIGEIDAELRSAIAGVHEEVATGISETEQQLSQLQERRLIILDRLQRSTITAPQDGRVLNLTFHTKGGVVAPGQRVMEIVPVDEEAILLAHIPVTEVDRVFKGQDAIVRLTAFNRNQTPELQGQVKNVSADTLVDPVSNLPYYSAEILLSQSEAGDISDFELVPGMPVEVLITTGERLVASYISRPLQDAFSQTFRDE